MRLDNLMHAVIGVCYLIFFSSVSVSKEVDIIGYAYDLAGEKMLYHEVHRVSPDGFDHEVVFIDDKNQLLAKKVIDYRSGFFAPSFIQEDFTLGEVIQVANLSDELQLKYIEKGGVDAKKVTVNTLLEAKYPLVIDAGFDNYLRSHWQTLIEGDPVEFYFPAPTRGSQVELVVKKIACKEAGNYKAIDEEVCFKINSAFWLFRLFVDPIEVRYFLSNKKLSRYRGLANIPNGKGANYAVDIRYEYQ